MSESTSQQASTPRRGFVVRCLLPLVTFLFGNLSVKWVRRWAKFFYYLFWPFTGGIRKIIYANLAIAFPDTPERKRKQLAKKNLQYIFELGLDWLHFFTHPDDVPKRLVLSQDILDRKQARQQDSTLPPAIYCTLHLGNWELCSHISYLTGRPGAVIAARFNSDWLNDLAEQLRTSQTDTVLIPVQGATRGILHALKDHYDIGILIDQHVSPKKGGIFVNFFQLAVTASPLPAVIAMRHRLPMILLGCYKRPDGNFSIDLEPLPRLPSEYASPAELTQDIFRGYERLILRHPEQYLWLYRYWRSCPANAPEEYFRRYPFYAKTYNVQNADEAFFHDSTASQDSPAPK